MSGPEAPPLISAPPPQMSVPPPAPPPPMSTTDPALLQSRGDLYSGQYDAGPNMCVAPPAQQQAPQAPQQAPAPPATGLASYQPVPDNFVGPLAPNQIRQSQYNDLRTYNFDQFNVVPDGFVGPLQPTQMTQAQYAQMQQAWLNIGQGQGMNISGRPQDQAEFRRMLRNSMGDSPTMRNLVSDIGNDADPAHRVQADVGNHPGVFVDSFDSNQIDMNDLRQFPRAPANAHPNEMTQGEQLAHILAERRSALTSANPADFGPAHAEGTRVHNQYRAERGQSAELSAFGSAPDARGQSTATMSYADGTSHVINLNRNMDIVGQRKP